MNLDHELRKALARKDPPHGFDRTVMARIALGETVRQGGSRHRLLRFALPLAASVLVASGAAYYVNHEQHRMAQEQRAAAERTARDVTRALQITSDALAVVRAKLQETNHHEPPIHP
jgi:hypothetical protein